MDFLLQLDADTLLAVNSWHTEFLDPIMRGLTRRQAWPLLYLSIVMVLWWRFGWQRALIAIVATAVAVGLTDLVCSSIIRPLVERMRPSNPDNELSALVHIVDGYRSGKYGFPSAHAANSAAVAMCTSLIMRSRLYSIFMVLWVCLQCYTRLYLGVHYPGDILVGLIIGSLISYGVYYPISRYVSFKQYNAKSSVLPVVIVGVGICLYVILKCHYIG